MTRIELKNCYGEFAVRLERDDLAISEVVEDLVIPLLLAAGYSQIIIDECLGLES